MEMKLIKAFVLGAGRYCLEAAKPVLAEKLVQRLTFGAPPPRIETLSYAEAVRIAVRNRPDQLQEASAVLMKLPHQDGVLMVWAYLDGNLCRIQGKGGRPFEKRLLVSGVDEELAEIFGEGDTIRFV